MKNERRLPEKHAKRIKFQISNFLNSTVKKKSARLVFLWVKWFLLKNGALCIVCWWIMVIQWPCVHLRELYSNSTHIIEPLRCSHTLPTFPNTYLYGRKIDLKQLENEENPGGIYNFLYQSTEAFDRVDRTFLYKTMRAFWAWIEFLWSEGYDREGCPLSALSYILVIEVFALQLRKVEAPKSII